jgi:chemotaxis protein methyltransferase CheR
VNAQIIAHLRVASAVIERELGLHFPPDRFTDLHRALRGVGRDLGGLGIEEVLRRVEQLPSFVHRREVIAALTVGETYFYRDPALFALLARTFLPAWRARTEGGRALRAWSAGCCTGEEAYTLAIELVRNGAWLGPAGFQLLATDLNPRSLHHAELGVYRAWSFRDAPPWLQSSYCSSLGDERFEVRPEIRRHVRFAPLNLVRDDYPSPVNGTAECDLILCRNVLMYFSTEQRLGAWDRLVRALVPGGWLVTSAAEASHLHHPLLAVRRREDITYFERLARPAVRATPEIAPEVFVLGTEVIETPRRAVPEAAPVARESVAELLDRARAAAAHGDLTAALRACDHALVRERFAVSAHLLRVSILDELGRWPEAEAAVRTALYLEPHSIMAHFRLAALARRAGRTRTAQRHAKVARELAAALAAEALVPDSDQLTAAEFLALTAPTTRMSAA